MNFPQNHFNPTENESAKASIGQRKPTSDEINQRIIEIQEFHSEVNYAIQKLEADCYDHFAEIRREIDLEKELLTLKNYENNTLKVKIEEKASNLIYLTNEKYKIYSRKLNNLKSSITNFKLENIVSILNKEPERMDINKREFQEFIDHLNRVDHDVKFIRQIMPYCQFKSNEAFSSFGSLFLRELNYNLVSCSNDGAIKIFDLDTFQCIKSLQVSKVKVSCLEVNSIYQQLIVIAEDRFVKIYDLINFNLIDTINVYSESNFSRIRCIKMLSPNKFALGSCTEIQIWDLQTKNLCKNLECTGVICLETLDTSRIFTGLWDAGGIKLWDLNKLTCVQTFLGHSSDVTCLCLMNRNGNLTLVSGSNDKTIKIWSLDPIEKSACLKTLIGHSNSVTKLEIAFNKFDLISCSCDGTIKIWNIDEETCVTMNAHDGAIRCVKTYQTNFLASCSFDETIKIWDLSSLKCLKTLYDHKDIVRELKVF